MVKLYIKQKVFAISDKYKVYDENNNVVYYFESEVFTFGAKTRMYDATTKQLKFFIKQKVLFSFYRQYIIYDAFDNQLATIKQKTLIKPSLEIKLNENEEYTVKGDFLAYNFQLLNDNLPIGTVNKKYLSWGDTYELDISSDFEPSFFTAIVVTIDTCLHNSSNNS